MIISFSKYHGLGNDFIVIDDRKKTFPSNNSLLIKKLCHRNFGVGADGGCRGEIGRSSCLAASLALSRNPVFLCEDTDLGSSEVGFHRSRWREMLGRICESTAVANWLLRALSAELSISRTERAMGGTK